MDKKNKREKSKQSENRCDASNKSGTQCGKVKGFGTEHLGSGKCKFHGGNSVSTTHLITAGSFDEMVELYQNQADIFDLRKEIATLRAMRDEEVLSFQSSARGTDERDSSIYKLNTIISSIIRSVDKFHTILRREHFALTIDQARQVRDGMKKIIGEEARTLMKIIEPAMPELGAAIDAWGQRVQDRLNSELTLDDEANADAVKGLS